MTRARLFSWVGMALATLAGLVLSFLHDLGCLSGPAWPVLLVTVGLLAALGAAWLAALECEEAGE
jgi:formate-dependent nitrite reductase membrane component NrfD